MLSALYPWVLSLHIVSMVAWMAGLFYLPRLYVYHAERGQSEPVLSETFKVMEEKLLRLIMNPAMIATWVFGLLLAVTPGVVAWGFEWWFPIKFGLVVLMTVFHMWLARVRRIFSEDRNTQTGRYFRAMNEVPTVLLLAIVVLVVVKPI
ncbi:MAG: protoporphyrinogen oxidase HemJ [Pseudomonadota bacterium]